MQLRCVVWKGLNPPRAQGQARLPQTKRIHNEKLKISKAKTFQRQKKDSNSNHAPEHDSEHKKLHAQRPIGAQFGAQKVARSTIHPEHALEHKKLHAQRPIRSTLWSTKSCTLNDPSEHNLAHKKLHAQRPIRSTLWSTKSCTLKDLSGARFGAQKVASSTTHPEHVLEQKKLHAQRPIRSTLWSTKSCTLNDPSGARKTHLNALWFRRRQQPSHGWACTSSRPLRGCFFSCLFLFVELKTPKRTRHFCFEAQKVARSATHPEHALEHKKLHAQRPIGAQFGAQKVARSATHPEHALEHQKLHAQRPIRSTLWSTKSCTLNNTSGARFGAEKVARSTTHPEHALEHKKLHAQRPIRSTETHLNALWFRKRQQPSHGWVCTSSRPLRGSFFLVFFYPWN